MSGCFESMQWNACVNRVDLGLYSYTKDLLGIGVRTHVNSKAKIPSTGGSEGLGSVFLLLDSLSLKTGECRLSLIMSS